MVFLIVKSHHEVFNTRTQKWDNDDVIIQIPNLPVALYAMGDVCIHDRWIVVIAGGIESNHSDQTGQTTSYIDP